MWCIGLLSRFIYVLYSHHHSVRVVLNPREVLGDARMDRRPAAFAAHRKAIRMDRDQYRLSIFRYRHWTTLIPHASCTILGRGAHIARAQIQREANQTASVGDDARTEVQQTSNRDHLARALTGLAPAGYRRFVVIKRMANEWRLGSCTTRIRSLSGAGRDSVRMARSFEKKNELKSGCTSTEATVINSCTAVISCAPSITVMVR